jgi:hypothetical protein
MVLHCANFQSLFLFFYFKFIIIQLKFYINRENISWLGTTKKIGQTSGQYVSNQIFLLLESTNISNNYIRPIFKLIPKDHGIITIESMRYL